MVDYVDIEQANTLEGLRIVAPPRTKHVVDVDYSKCHRKMIMTNLR